MKTLLSLSLSLSVAGCAARDSAHRMATPDILVAPAREAAAPVDVAEKCPDDELARRVAVATATLAEGTSGVIYAPETFPALECALRARHLSVHAEETGKRAAVMVRLAAGPQALESKLEGSASEATVVAWTDGSSEPTTAKRLEFVARLGDSVAGKWSHIVVDPATEDRRRLTDLEYRLAKAGFLPPASGLEVGRFNDDGSADVRILGYPQPELDDGVSSWTVKHLWIASDHRLYENIVLLPSSSPAAAAVEPELRALAQRTEREIAVNHEVFGPPYSNRTADLVKQSMHVAVGTCDQTWIEPVAVVLRGRLHPRSDGVSLDVEGIEQTLALSTWTALAPRYTKAMSDASKAVTRGDAAAALAATRAFHRDLQRAYGASTQLLELDVVLRRLERAFEHASSDEALRALDQTRCPLPDTEQTLRDSLSRQSLRKD